MKGFKDTTKMMTGHHFARGGHTLQSHFPHPSSAPGRGAGPSNPMGGLTDHGNPNDAGTEGHAAVHREVPSNQMEAEHGGRGPLIPGYKKGGAHHFHVHKHYHTGGSTKTKSRSYRKHEKQMEMQAEHEHHAHENEFATGGTRNRMAGGGNWMKGAVKRPGAFKAKAKRAGMSTSSYAAKVTKPGSGADTRTKRQANLAKTFAKFRPSKAKGGHIHDNTKVIPPDYKTGGTINRMATGGTRNRMGAGGALYKHGGIHESASHEKAEMGALHRIERKLSR